MPIQGLVQSFVVRNGFDAKYTHTAPQHRSFARFAISQKLLVLLLLWMMITRLEIGGKPPSLELTILDTILRTMVKV